MGARKSLELDWYVIGRQGRRLWAATKVEAMALARTVADELGRAVKVGRREKKPARSYKRNPAPSSAGYFMLYMRQRGHGWEPGPGSKDRAAVQADRVQYLAENFRGDMRIVKFPRRPTFRQTMETAGELDRTHPVGFKANPARRSAGYFMLYTREPGHGWAPQFGSKDRSDVTAERDDYRRDYRPADLAIVKFPRVPTQRQSLAMAAELERTKPAAFKANPFDLTGMAPGMWRQEEAARARRAEYLARTKPERIRKSLGRAGRLGPGGGAAATTAKTGKFLVVGRNKSERLELYRPSRIKADQLAAQLEAAGYRVSIEAA